MSDPINQIAIISLANGCLPVGLKGEVDDLPAFLTELTPVDGRRACNFVVGDCKPRVDEVSYVGSGSHPESVVPEWGSCGYLVCDELDHLNGRAVGRLFMAIGGRH